MPIITNYKFLVCCTPQYITHRHAEVTSAYNSTIVSDKVTHDAQRHTHCLDSPVDISFSLAFVHGDATEADSPYVEYNSLTATPVSLIYAAVDCFVSSIRRKKGGKKMNGKYVELVCCSERE